MDLASVSLIIFGLGIATEAFLILKQKGLGHALTHSFIILGAFALFVLWGSIQGGKDFGAAAGLFMISLLMFVFYFSFAYRKEALPRIGEKILLPFTIIFWFIFFSSWGEFTTSQPLLVLFSIPTIAILYSSFTSGETGILSKIIFYIWFVFLSIVFISFQASILVPSILQAESGSAPMFAYLFFGGMVFLRLSVYVFTLFALFNLSNNRMGVKNDYPELMIGKCSGEEIHPGIAALTILVLGGGLALSFLFHFFPTDFLICVAILVTAHLAPTS